MAYAGGLARRARESVLEPLSKSDYETLKSAMGLRLAATWEDLAGALSRDGLGRELWRYLATAAFLAVLGEVAATRWIALRRKTTSCETIDFALPSASPTSLAASWARLQAEAGLAGAATPESTSSAR